MMSMRYGEVAELICVEATPVMTGRSVRLMQRIVAITHELVELSMQADWNAVLDRMEARRSLLQELMDGNQGEVSVQLPALAAAVAESERALMRVVAHAIAGSRRSGAEYAMYH